MFQTHLKQTVKLNPSILYPFTLVHAALRTEWLPVVMLKVMQRAKNKTALYISTLEHKSQTNIVQKFSSSFPGHTIVSIPKTNP
jgi:hypothetical protein